MRMGDLRDPDSCLESIRRRLGYASFRAAAPEVEEELDDHLMDLSEETDQAVAEGMLHTVVSLPQPGEASARLEQFAAELQSLRSDATSETEGDPVAEAYLEFCDELARVQRGLPAVVEIFKAYAEGRGDLGKEPLDLLEEAWHKLEAEPEAALRLFGEAGCLCLRGLEDVDNLSVQGADGPLAGTAAHWLGALVGTVGYIEDELEEYPLGEVALARDQWRAPDDEQRIEYKREKLTRLGIRETAIQELLLPLFAHGDKRLSKKEKKAIVDAGSKVVPGLIAIASDYDSRLRSSISGGDAATKAVQLLGEMRAEEAVPSLLEILQNSHWMTIVHDQTLRALHEEMPDLAFDKALEIFDHTADNELKSEMVGILAMGGRGKPEVFERLIGYFRQKGVDKKLISGYLADLGDRRALPDLHEAFRECDDLSGVVEIEEAILALGGALSAAEKQKSLQFRGRTSAGARPAGLRQLAFGNKPVHVTKIGRNAPCPCGSGKKYKKCCGG